jgi:CHAT domain-containing protein
VAQTLNNLANVYAAQGRFTEAIPLRSRALAITEKAFGPDHPDVALQESNLGLDDMKRADWASALRHLRRAADIQAKRAVVAAKDETSVTDVQPADRYAFVNLTTTAWRVSRAEPRQRADLVRETFETAQQAAASNAGHALEQMAARFSTGNAALAGRLRAKQDLIGQWQALNKALIAAASAIAGKRDEAQIAKLRQDLAGIDKQLEDIDQSLARDFPAYSELTSPRPVAVAEVQKLLADEEALLLTLDTPGGKLAPAETFVWVVTKTKVHWVRSDLGTASLQREVAALRCGLDYAGSWAVENSPCPALTNTTYTDADDAVGKPLPFDPTRAHALYKSLFGGLTDVLRGRRLIVVASGALTQLPFQVLVTETPDPKLKGAEALRRARWLIRDHAITVLPSVTALKALRELAKDTHATRPLIGFGNPLLDGGPDDTERAYRARQNATCPVAVASDRGLGRGVKQIATRGGPAEVAAQLRAAPPLPETADELCAVAKDLHLAASDIHIGARATLPEVGRLSSAGELAQYHIIHFATHGAMSGQITDNAEPGLILTPPETPSAEDDGYLSASRIASLKLDADWVILSACNTAAGGANSAEALSGLARAFFYAGARALLVSHWSVNSVAAVRLVTGAIGRMTANNKLGRAEALRQSMLSLIYTGSDVGAHPATWAPFVVVGEGAASK